MAAGARRSTPSPGRRFAAAFRAFDDGLAFRYEVLVLPPGGGQAVRIRPAE